MLRRQNRVLFWIDGHIPSRVIEFFLTDWVQENAMHGHRIGYVWVSSFDPNPERRSRAGACIGRRDRGAVKLWAAGEPVERRRRPPLSGPISLAAIRSSRNGSPTASEPSSNARSRTRKGDYAVGGRVSRPSWKRLPPLHPPLDRSGCVLVDCRGCPPAIILVSLCSSTLKIGSGSRCRV